MKRLRRIKIHQSLVRPQLMLGCERELFLFTLLSSATLVFALQSRLTIIIGGLILVFCLWGLREMAKRDPQMSKKYMESRKYKGFYPARSTAFAKPANLQK